MVKVCFSFLVLVLVSATAHALPNNDHHAYTLRSGQGHVGLLDVGYGITEEISFSTVWPASVARVPNVGVKWMFMDGETFSAALDTSLFYYDLSFHRPDAPPFTSTLISTALTGTWDLNPFFVSVGLVSTQVLTTGSVSDSSSAEDDDYTGDFTSVLNLETNIMRSALFWDRGDGFAWLFDLSISLSQTAGAQGDTIFAIDNERVEGRGVLQGRGEVDLSAEKARNFSVCGLWYWRHFHIKAGLTMGHLLIPYLNIFPIDGNNRPYKMMLPKLDIYARF